MILIIDKSFFHALGSQGLRLAVKAVIPIGGTLVRMTNLFPDIVDIKVKQLRLQLPEKTSQRKLADMLVLQGLDVDKNAVQRIEAGQRFVTDIELKILARVLNTSYNELLGSPDSE